MSKRCFTLCMLIITILLLFPLTAYADVVWTPPDSFFEKNYEKCEPLNRSYYINSESGHVSVKKEPGSDVEVGTILNGEVYNVSFTYDHSGEQWGVILLDRWAASSIAQVSTGWVLMDQLLLVYDNISFVEDHSNEFYQYSGDYGALFEADKLIFWTWPGSGEVAMVHDDKADRNQDPAQGWLVATSAYMDNEGREWGLIPYFFAWRDMWVCLSDPGNSDIPAFNIAPPPELFPYIAPNGWETTTPGSWFSTHWLIIVLVAALAIGTGVLIRVLWKPKSEV